THKLTGPVFDFKTNNIFAGDDGGGMNYFRDTGSTTGACANSGAVPCFGSRVTTYFGTSTSITDPPILDGTKGKVHFFGISSGAGNPQVVQTDTTLGSVVTATVGTASSPQIHAGMFDNTYFDSGTGYLYVCGHST